MKGVLKTIETGIDDAVTEKSEEIERLSIRLSDAMRDPAMKKEIKDLAIEMVDIIPDSITEAVKEVNKEKEKIAAEVIKSIGIAEKPEEPEIIGPVH